MQYYDIVIIGAGLGGLTAAYELSKNKNYKILVLEKEKYIGGRASSLNYKGYVLDRGAVYLLIPGDSTSKLIKELNIDKRLVKVSKKVKYWFDNNWHELDFSGTVTLIKSFLKFRLISHKTKINPRTLYFFRKTIKILRDSKKDYDSLKNYDNISAKNFLKNYFNEEVIKCVFEPIGETFLFESLDKLSAGGFLAAIGAFVDGKNNFYHFYDGMSDITSTIEKNIIKNNVKIIHKEVIKLKKVEKYFIINCRDGQKFKSSIVICNIPIPKLLKVYKGFPKFYKDRISKIRYSSIITINYGLRKPLDLIKDDHLVFLPIEKEGPIRLVGEFTSKNSNIAPKGKGLLYVVCDPISSEKLINLTNNKILNIVNKELGKIFNDFNNKLEFSKIFKWEHALCVADVNFFSKNAKIRTPVDGLYICGDCVYLGLDGVAKSGILTANEIKNTKIDGDKYV